MEIWQPLLRHSLYLLHQIQVFGGFFLVIVLLVLRKKNKKITGEAFTNMWIYIWWLVGMGINLIGLVWKAYTVKLHNLNFTSIPKVPWFLFFSIRVFKKHLTTINWISALNCQSLNSWLNKVLMSLCY